MVIRYDRFMLLEPIEQKKSSEKAKEAILRYIHTNNLKPGSRLSPDRELASMLHCSRTVVREALKGLETIGVIEMKVGRGIFVSEFTLSNLLEKYHPVLSEEFKDLQCLKEARLAIEVGIIGLAVDRATREDIEGLNAIIDEMERTERHEALLEPDIRFHQMLATIARSPLLAEFSSLLRKFFRLSYSYDQMILGNAGDPEKCRKMIESTHQEHHALVAAIETRDKNLARRLVESHLMLPEEQGPKNTI